ncbi:hypothetical protein FRB95_011554 [Tulasnella sp. JGI-2019a]|nr:hypothetical protein FRB95_011554 [Tulasnella sp. JGI-2019a]
MTKDDYATSSDARTEEVSDSNHPPSPSPPPTKVTNDEDVLALKRRYLLALEPSELVELILRLDKDREMPIFPSDLSLGSISRSKEEKARNISGNENGFTWRMGQQHHDDGSTVNNSSITTNGDRAPSISPTTATTSRAPHLSFLLSTPSAPPPVSSPSHQQPMFRSAPSENNVNPSPSALSPLPQTAAFNVGQSSPTIRSPSPSPPFLENTSVEHQHPPDYPPPPPAAPAPAPGPSAALARSSWDTGMPSYEVMICMALAEIADPEGCAPKVIFDWMNSHFPLVNNFRASAHQALQKTFKRGRLQKIGSKYRLNPGWSGGTTSRRTTRRPQAASGAAPPVLPFSVTTTNSWQSMAPVPVLSQQPAGVSSPSLTAPPHPQAHHVPQRQPYNSYHHYHPPSPPPPPQLPHPQAQHHANGAFPPGVALLQAIAGINGMIGQNEHVEPRGEEDDEMEEREEEDHGDGDEDAEGEMEAADADGDRGATTEDEDDAHRRQAGERTDEGRDDNDDDDDPNNFSAQPSNPA